MNQFYQPFNGFQYQPSLPTMPPNGLTGHVVASDAEIKPQDVPMNGNAAYFPAQDGSVIYAKAWNPNGSITTVRYVPQMDEKQEVPAVTLQDVMDQLNDIQDLLKKPAAKRAAKKPSEKEPENE